MNVSERGQAMYVTRNVETWSCNNCCSGKEIIVTYSEHGFVDLGIHHAIRMPHNVTWSVRLYNIFSHYFINDKIFENKNYWTQNAFWLSVQCFSETIAQSETISSKFYYKCLWILTYTNNYCCQLWITLEVYRQSFLNYSKCYAVSSSLILVWPFWFRVPESLPTKVLFLLFDVFFMYKYVLYYCYPLSTQLQLTNISIIS